jgi:hypothetical protein
MPSTTPSIEKENRMNFKPHTKLSFPSQSTQDEVYLGKKSTKEKTDSIVQTNECFNSIIFFIVSIRFTSSTLLAMLLLLV